jgi:uncharacterized protein DUF4403
MDKPRYARTLVAMIAVAAMGSACEPAAALDAAGGERGPVRDRSAERDRDRAAGKPRPATGSCVQLKPPRAAAAAASGRVRLPRSSIAVTIPVALSSLQPEIDRLIPASLSDPSWPTTHQVSDEVCATWYLARGPVALAAARQQLTIDIPGKFGMIADPYVGVLGAGCTQPYVSCGNGSAGAAPIPVMVRLASTLSFDRGYRFSGRVANVGTTFTQPCQIGLGAIDATPIVQGVIDGEINRQLARINDAIRNRGDLRPQLEPLWAALQQPRKLAEDLWLVVHPAAVSGRLDAVDAGTVAAQLAVEGSIEIVAAASAPAATPVALPDLDASAPPASGSRLVMSGSLEYPALASHLQHELVGKQLAIARPTGTVHRVAIHELRVSGPVACAGAQPCLELAVELEGDACGVVTVVGRPEFDAGAGDVVLRDVDFSVDSHSAVLRAAAWLGHGELVQQIAGAARFSIAPAVDRVHRLAATALPISLSGTLELSGSLGSPAVSLVAGATGVDYRIALGGTLSVTPRSPPPRTAP